MKTLLAIVLLTLVYGTIYATVQHEQRLSADEPQIQIAEDAARQLQTGSEARSVVQDPVDPSISLAPFVMVFGKDGQLQASSGSLKGAPPKLPDGVLADIKVGHEHRFTWQPEPKVRIAAVLLHYKDSAEGYALSGRSLRETEHREKDTMLFTAAAWLVSIGCVVGWRVVESGIRRRREES